MSEFRVRRFFLGSAEEKGNGHTGVGYMSWPYWVTVVMGVWGRRWWRWPILSVYIGDFVDGSPLLQAVYEESSDEKPDQMGNSIDGRSVIVRAILR